MVFHIITEMFIYKLLLLFLLQFKAFAIDVSLIVNYMNYKSLKSAVIFTCLDKKGQINLTKELVLHAIQLYVVNIDNSSKVDYIKNFTRHHAIIFDATCKHTQQYLNLFDDDTYFGDKNHWLIRDNNLYFEKFKNLPLNINSDIHVAISSDLESWKIFDLYNPGYKHGGQYHFKRSGCYNKQDGYKINRNKAIYFSRRDMTGMQFNLIAVLTYPVQGNVEEYMVSEKYMKLDIFNKACYIILKDCMEYYNFTMKFNITKSWGYHLEFNKTYDGIVGALQRREADFGTGIYLKSERLEIIDYGARMWILKNAFVLRRVPEQSSFLTFLKPLSKSVWYLVITTMIALVVVLKSLEQIESAISKEKYQHSIMYSDNTWSFLILFVIGTFCQQGSPNMPRTYCGRILVATTFMYSILLYQMYSASIVSSLLITPTSVIHSLEDLLENDINVTAENVLYIKDLLQKTNYSVLKDLQRKKLKNNYIDPQEGLRLVAQTRCAYHVDLSMAYPIIHATFSDVQICELQEIKMIQDAGLFVPLQKNSPFRDMINFGIRRMEETGLHQRLVSQLIVRKPICLDKSFKAASVGLTEFLPVLIILIFGIGLSLVILIIEKIQWSKKLFKICKSKHQK